MYFVIFVTILSALAAIGFMYIWALLHCRGNRRLDRAHMERWLILIAVTPPIGAMLYLYLHRDDPVELNMWWRH